jgi:hypothetical protein
MSILEERGLFWWDDEKIAVGNLTPDSYVAGLLKIEENGRTTLELDGYLPSPHGPMAAVARDELLISKGIRGVLKESNKHVLLLDLFRHGGRFSSHGISFQGFLASHCLISESAPVQRTKLKFRRLQVSLEGLEEWLQLRAIEVSRGRKVISAKYKRPSKAQYRLEGGSLTIDFELRGKSGGAVFGNEVTMKETALLSLRFGKALDIEAIKTQYELLEDMFMLLTNTAYPLAWPILNADQGASYRFYFTKIIGDTNEPAPKYFDCVTNFIQLRESFGSIWSNWKKSREMLGPGLYLYLGTRRGIKMYIEHRFVNLVWGIEAFHRRKHSDTGSNPLSQKIARIVGQIKELNDRKWLTRKLENAHEPTLGERIYQVLSVVPLGLDAERLRKFSTECAKLRNDISHFGGDRHEGRSYNDFILDTNDKAEALSTLYHLLLLHEIGISENILKWWVFEGFKSLPIKYHFVQAGLLDKSVLEQKNKGQN